VVGTGRQAVTVLQPAMLRQIAAGNLTVS
jgi:hypothetical protein